LIDRQTFPYLPSLFSILIFLPFSLFSSFFPSLPLSFLCLSSSHFYVFLVFLLIFLSAPIFPPFYSSPSLLFFLALFHLFSLVYVLWLNSLDPCGMPHLHFLVNFSLYIVVCTLNPYPLALISDLCKLGSSNSNPFSITLPYDTQLQLEDCFLSRKQILLESLSVFFSGRKSFPR
jgi:hypothetical protein